MLSRPSGLCPDELKTECNGDPACDLVLQGEQIDCVAVETLGPQMRVALRIDQLGVDTDLVTRPPGASFKHIAYAQFAADLPSVDRLFPVGERGVARDD